MKFLDYLIGTLVVMVPYSSQILTMGKTLKSFFSEAMRPTAYRFGNAY